MLCRICIVQIHPRKRVLCTLDHADYTAPARQCNRSKITQAWNVSALQGLDHREGIDGLSGVPTIRHLWGARKTMLISLSHFRCLTGRRGRGGAYSFVACLGHLTTDHAFLSRRSILTETPPTIWAFVRCVFLFHMVRKAFC